MTIPMSAVLISRIARHAVARWFSVAAGVVMTVVQVGTLFIGTASPLYLYFSAIEIVTTAVIALVRDHPLAHRPSLRRRACRP